MFDVLAHIDRTPFITIVRHWRHGPPPTMALDRYGQTSSHIRTFVLVWSTPDERNRQMGICMIAASVLRLLLHPMVLSCTKFI